MKNDSSVQSRLLSLDFFRGFTMFLLIAEYTRLFGYMIVPEFSGTIIGKIGAQLHHHPWNGLRFWDLIQPFFMFIVGVAMPLSYAKRIKKGESHSSILKHILLRCLLLLLLGWWIYCVPAGKIVFRFQNVLAQLSVTILIAFLIIRKPAITQLLISLGLIGLMEFIYRIFWIDGFNKPFTPDQNFGAWFDMLIAGELSGGHWVSINVISTSVHTIWGVLAGKLLMSNRTHRKKLIILVIAGLAGLVIGYSLNPITPIIKRIATSSFVLASGGWTTLALVLSFWLIDMLKLRKGVLFFAIVGMNPLFIYLFAHIGGADLIAEVVRPFTNTLFTWTGEAGVDILTALITTFGLWYICFWMYRRKIFIKI